MDWIELTQDRDQWSALVKTVMNIRFLLNDGESLSSWATGSFQRSTQLYRDIKLVSLLVCYQLTFPYIQHIALQNLLSIGMGEFYKPLEENSGP
jgi:hypothetical protein